MKIRAIPFGYRYDNGHIVIDETTSSVVKEIFSLYVNGKSLLDISSLLNNMCIEYRPGVIGWNKARIKRIIEDKRYLGEKDYPIIISEDLADKANNLKTRKNTQSNIDKDNLIYRLDAPVYCPCCNTLMKRIYEPRNKIPERWRCENSECHHIIPIADTDLLSELQQLLNSIIINPDMIESHVSENYISMETFRTENEINHLLDSRSISKDIVKAKLYEAIAHKYGDLNTQKYESKRLRDVFRNQKLFAEFPIELFNQTVISISFDDHENIVLTLTNGQIMRKERNYESTEKSPCHSPGNQRQRRCQEQIQTEACCCVLPSVNPTGRTNQQL